MCSDHCRGELCSPAFLLSMTINHGRTQFVPTGVSKEHHTNQKRTVAHPLSKLFSFFYRSKSYIKYRKKLEPPDPSHHNPANIDRVNQSAHTVPMMDKTRPAVLMPPRCPLLFATIAKIRPSTPMMTSMTGIGKTIAMIPSTKEAIANPLAGCFGFIGGYGYGC